MNGPSHRLPNPCVTSYNGVSLKETTSTDRVSARAVLDSSNRTTIYSEFTFTFTTHFQADATDAEVLAVRQKLMEPGKPFTFDGRGFGPFVMNKSRYGPKDVVWGPQTREVSFDLFGPGATRRMTWQFVVRTPDCKTARTYGRAMELNYTVAHRPSKTGLVRVITGHLRIPNNRAGVNDRQALESADDWRDKVLPPLLPGFDREFNSFTLSEDRSRLDWTVTDTEFGLNIPPKYVIEKPRVRLGAATAPGQGLASWVGTATGTYKLAKSCPDKLWPVRHFFGVLCREVIGESTAEMIRNPGPDAKAGAVVPVWVSVENPDFYGEVPTYAMSLSWAFTSSLKRLLSTTTFWNPAPDGDWKVWAASLQNSVLSPYGSAQVRFRAGDDYITDLCDPGRRAVPAPVRFSESVLRTPAADAAMKALADVIPDPTPQNSWISYEQRLFAEVDGGMVPITPLPKKPPKRTAGSGILGLAVGGTLNAVKDVASRMPKVVPGQSSAAGGGRLDNQTAGRTGKLASETQQRVPDYLYVWLIGRAARAAFPVPCPVLTDVNGVEAEYLPRIDRQEGFTCWVGHNAGLFPIYHAKWALRYRLKGVPGSIPVPPNPLLDDSDF